MKIKKIVSMIVIFAVIFTMSLGAAWGDSNAASTDFTNAGCTITDIRVIGTEANNTYYDENVKKGKTYYYKVKGYKVVGGKKIHSKYSKIVSKRSTTGQIGISNLKVSKSGKVTGTIGKNKNADGYYIYYAPKKTESYKLVKKVGKSDLKLNFSVPAGKSQYYFKIRGYINVNGKRYLGTLSTPYEVIKDKNKIVNIPNEELKKAMGLSGTVRVKELEQLKEIYFEEIDCDDADFTFLKYCTNLEDLIFWNCPLNSIEIICDSVKNTPVYALSIEHTNVQDISSITVLNNLRYLTVQGLPVMNTSIIKQLPKLESFNYSLSENYFHTKHNPFFVIDFTNIKDICDSEGISYLDIFDYEGWVEVEAVMDSFIREEIEPSMSDYEKIKRVHDFICRKNTYGEESSTGDCRHRYQYCALIEGHGACIDYAMAFIT